MDKYKGNSNITIKNLFEILQKEYLICVLRSKIYPIAKHKVYWNRIAEQKKHKILDICKKTIVDGWKKKEKLISIFDDEYLYSKLERETYNEFGLPNFYYPNAETKEQQIYWDIKNYFNINSNVKFIDHEDNYKIKFGIIKEIIIENNKIIIISSDKSEFEIEFQFVSRIIS